MPWTRLLTASLASGAAAGLGAWMWADARAWWHTKAAPALRRRDGGAGGGDGHAGWDAEWVRGLGDRRARQQQQQQQQQRGSQQQWQQWQQQWQQQQQQQRRRPGSTAGSAGWASGGGVGGGSGGPGDPQGFYRTLGVPPDASTSDIQAAFRAAAFKVRSGGPASPLGACLCHRCGKRRCCSVKEGSHHRCGKWRCCSVKEGFHHRCGKWRCCSVKEGFHHRYGKQSCCCVKKGFHHSLAVQHSRCRNHGAAQRFSPLSVFRPSAVFAPQRFSPLGGVRPSGVFAPSLQPPALGAGVGTRMLVDVDQAFAGKDTAHRRSHRRHAFTPSPRVYTAATFIPLLAFILRTSHLTPHTSHHVGLDALLCRFSFCVAGI
eukprot:363947-Chlamydomonas_euryale.AAC.8